MFFRDCNVASFYHSHSLPAQHAHSSFLYFLRDSSELLSSHNLCYQSHSLFWTHIDMLTRTGASKVDKPSGTVAKSSALKAAPKTTRASQKKATPAQSTKKAPMPSTAKTSATSKATGKRKKVSEPEDEDAADSLPEITDPAAQAVIAALQKELQKAKAAAKGPTAAAIKASAKVAEQERQKSA